MAWTAITGAQYWRDGLRHASDPTDAEWASIEPLLPPPHSTVQGYFHAWSREGVLAQINPVRVMTLRGKVGHEASQTAGVIDSQSVKTTEAGAPEASTRARRSKPVSATSS